MTQSELSKEAVKHTQALTQTFLRQEVRERWFTFLLNPTKRRKILDRLNHKFKWDLKPQYMHQQPPSNFKLIQQQYHDAYVIADQKEFDNQLMPIYDAICALGESHSGIIVSIIPGKLAIYKDEAPADALWLYPQLPSRAI